MAQKYNLFLGLFLGEKKRGGEEYSFDVVGKEEKK